MAEIITGPFHMDMNRDFFAGNDRRTYRVGLMDTVLSNIRRNWENPR